MAKTIYQFREHFNPLVSVYVEYIRQDDYSGEWNVELIASSTIGLEKLETYSQLAEQLSNSLNNFEFHPGFEFEYWRFVQEYISTANDMIKQFEENYKKEEDNNMSEINNNNQPKKPNWFSKIFKWLIHHWKIVISVIIGIVLVILGRKTEIFNGKSIDNLIEKDIKQKEKEIKEIDKEVEEREKEIEKTKEEKENLINNTKEDVEKINKEIEKVDKELEKVDEKEKDNTKGEEKSVDDAIDHLNQVVFGRKEDE